MSAWIIRSGKYGEREAWAHHNNVAGAGWHEVPDMTESDTKDKVRVLVNAAFPTAQPGRQANYAGQLWVLRGIIKPGDLIVMPMKTTKKVAIGECASGYVYRADEGVSDRLCKRTAP